MQKTNAEILHHFYSLLLETNYNDEDISPEEILKDPSIQKYYSQFKLKISKNQAVLKKSAFESILHEVERLKKVGVEELKKLLTPRDSLQLQPLFNKFESLTEKDRDSIVADEELLILISLLKEKLDKAESNE